MNLCLTHRTSVRAKILAKIQYDIVAHYSDNGVVTIQALKSDPKFIPMQIEMSDFKQMLSQFEINGGVLSVEANLTKAGGEQMTAVAKAIIPGLVIFGFTHLNLFSGTPACLKDAKQCDNTPLIIPVTYTSDPSIIFDAPQDHLKDEPKDDPKDDPSAPSCKLM